MMEPHFSLLLSWPCPLLVHSLKSWKQLYSKRFHGVQPSPQMHIHNFHQLQLEQPRMSLGMSIPLEICCSAWTKVAAFSSHTDFIVFKFCSPVYPGKKCSWSYSIDGVTMIGLEYNKTWHMQLEFTSVCPVLVQFVMLHILWEAVFTYSIRLLFSYRHYELL